MNIAASIRARLTNISRKENIAFQVIIVRYLHERLLYRLSISHFANQFYLKGGNFLYALNGLVTRPTTDIDFLGHKLAMEDRQIKKIFAEIADIQYNDGVWFDAENIQLEQIAEQNLYTGVRLIFPAGFDSIKQTIQIDIGFGDQITPHAVSLKYPVLIAHLPAPYLLAYTTETVIAEKFQAMIALAGSNSRMKDFYDVHQLLSVGAYDETQLKEAIITTFKNRKTDYVENHSLFTTEFSEDSIRNKMWEAFLKKIGKKDSLAFPQIMKEINAVLKPIWESIFDQ